MPQIDPVIIVSGTRKASGHIHDDLVETGMKQLARLAFPWLGMSMDGPRGPTVVEGEATGVDSIARYVAQVRLGWPVVPMPAKWQECGPGCPPQPHHKKNQSGLYCPMAGPRRNQQMLDSYPDAPVLCMPRFGSAESQRSQAKGAMGMYDKAVEAGRLVLTIPIFIPDNTSGLW